jgi:hypothetical protein
MNNPVAWFEIYVEDLARATNFYETVLGITLKHLDSPVPHLQMMAFPANHDSYGATGTLVKMEGFVPGGSGTMVYFHCEDCAIEEGRVIKAGGTIKNSKMPIAPFGFISHVYDSEGNLIGLHSK